MIGSLNRDSLIQTTQVLMSFGLTEDIIRDAIIQGEVERDSATANDPPTRGGFDAYAQRVRVLRDHLVPEGWSADNTKNLCTVVTPDGRHAIAVVTGDGATGMQDMAPQPKYARGDATAYAVVPNQSSFDFYGNVNNRTDTGEQRGPMLWFLLVHRQPGSEQVRMELSLPESITEKGSVSSWHIRHVFEPIDLVGDALISNVSDAEDEIKDLGITRKNS